MSMADLIAKMLLDEGAAPGSSLHSWRCEYPDRYGDCDCVQAAAETIWAAISAIAHAELDEKDEWCQHCSGPIIPGEHRRVIEGDLACGRCVELYHKAEPLGSE